MLSPKEWLAEYQEAESNSDLYVMHELEIQIFLETIAIVKRGGYVSVSGKKIVFPDPSSLVKDSVLYDSKLELDDSSVQYPTEYAVRNQDCLLAGRNLREEGLNPVVLNMANRQNPGGGVMHGARAQEESIFRRSNIFLSLYQFASYAEQYGLKQRAEQYPMDRNYGGAYSPDVIVFRGEQSEGYPLLDNPYALSFVTVAALHDPALTSSHHLVSSALEGTRKRMQTILRIALRHGHDAIVLGAWGCGAFHNPPRDIARLFHETLESPTFKGRFKKVVFAILDDHNARKRHNPSGNFLPFQREFV